MIDGEGGWRRAEDALESAGQRLAVGRREHRGPPGPVDGRVTLGLPLTTGLGPKRTWLLGAFRRERIEGGDRHASPLHLHIGAYRGGFGLCWSRLSGPVPGRGDYRVVVDGSRETIRAEAPDTLGNFVAALDGMRWTPGDRA